MSAVPAGCDAPFTAAFPPHFRCRDLGADPSPCRLGQEFFTSVGIVSQVFSYLDLTSLGRAAQVCRDWRGAAQHNEPWMRFAAVEMIELASWAELICEQLQSLRQRFTGRVVERLIFLNATAKLLSDYAQKQLTGMFWVAFPDFWFAARLLRGLGRQLADTEKMLLGLLRSSHFKITINFDIFELVLHRYYDELTQLLPPGRAPWQDQADVERYTTPAPLEPQDGGDVDSRLAVIENEEARRFWLAHAGPQCWCPFDQLYGTLLRHCSRAIAEPERFKRYLRHILNFPCDGMITAYRFNILMGVFGPLDALVANFETYVLGQGFVGFMNAIKAEELFEELRPPVNTVLMRMSRQRPTYMAFTSYDASKRLVTHQRNIDPGERHVPLPTYLRNHFPGYVLAAIGLDDAAARAENTLTYAQHENSYVHMLTGPNPWP